MVEALNIYNCLENINLHTSEVAGTHKFYYLKRFLISFVRMQYSTVHTYESAQIKPNLKCHILQEAAMKNKKKQRHKFVHLFPSTKQTIFYSEFQMNIFFSFFFCFS